ncbi:hypothetical protein JHK85_010371 [Glycine max]|uniref:Uncharacterized protein n=1 Tax=Glycine soja TaxID=3848 RepID=A0A445L044_GLYSO|nr:hypothetical protein JHK85_010371 [Glycine max]RZC16498.1 hypothetical protein D0Y65_009676 [Glycine soja]
MAFFTIRVIFFIALGFVGGLSAPELFFLLLLPKTAAHEKERKRIKAHGCSYDIFHFILFIIIFMKTLLFYLLLDLFIVNFMMIRLPFLLSCLIFFFLFTRSWYDLLFLCVMLWNNLTKNQLHYYV